MLLKQEGLQLDGNCKQLYHLYITETITYEIIRTYQIMCIAQACIKSRIQYMCTMASGVIFLSLT